MKKNDNLRTPHWVYSQLGEFDLDPCAGLNTRIAATNWAIERSEDGLSRDWKGFVWCNPPFSEKEIWAQRMIDHNNGLLLLPERHSAPWLGPIAKASSIYFILGQKVNFEGGSSSNNVGSVLFAFGDEARKRIINCDLPGLLVNVILFRPRLAIHRSTNS